MSDNKDSDNSSIKSIEDETVHTSPRILQNKLKPCESEISIIASITEDSMPEIALESDRQLNSTKVWSSKAKSESNSSLSDSVVDTCSVGKLDNVQSEYSEIPPDSSEYTDSSNIYETKEVCTPIFTACKNSNYAVNAEKNVHLKSAYSSTRKIDKRPPKNIVGGLQVTKGKTGKFNRNFSKKRQDSKTCRKTSLKQNQSYPGSLILGNSCSTKHNKHVRTTPNPHATQNIMYKNKIRAKSANDIKKCSVKHNNSLSTNVYKKSDKKLKKTFKSNSTFESEVGERFVNLVQDVVKHSSLFAKSEECSAQKGTANRKISMKHSKSCPPRSQQNKDKNESMISNSKNNYTYGLNMYIEDQLETFDKNPSLLRSTLSNSRVPKLKIPGGISTNSSLNKTAFTNTKSAIDMTRLKTDWSEPDFASNDCQIVSRRLILPWKIASISTDPGQHDDLRSEVQHNLKRLKLPLNGIKVFKSQQIKLVSFTDHLIIVGEGASSVLVLGFLRTKRTFVAIKMFKLPHAGGKAKEIIDQAILSTYLNSMEITPKLYGLVTLNSIEANFVGLHDVAMVYEFIGHTPSCAVTTLANLCEKISNSKMYQDPASLTTIAHQNVLNLLKKVTEFVGKIHGLNVVMPGLDINKVLLKKEGDSTRVYLTSKLHPRKESTLAWPTISYFFLKNKRDTTFSISKSNYQVPPEVLRRGKYSIKSDVYEIGNIMVSVGQAYNIAPLQHLARRCLRQDSRHRPEVYSLMFELEKIMGSLENK